MKYLFTFSIALKYCNHTELAQHDKSGHIIPYVGDHEDRTDG